MPWDNFEWENSLQKLSTLVSNLPYGASNNAIHIATCGGVMSMDDLFVHLPTNNTRAGYSLFKMVLSTIWNSAVRLQFSNSDMTQLKVHSKPWSTIRGDWRSVANVT